MTLHEKIHALYLLDKQLRGLQSRLDGAKRRSRAQQTKFERFTQQYNELADQIKQSKAKVSALETEAQSIEDRINKHREQMNNVRTNKEYSALLIEVNTLKDDKGKIEESTLGQMGSIEEQDEQLAQIKARVDQQQKLVDSATAEVKSCSDEIGDQLEKMTSERNAAAAEVPGQSREIFERLSEMHEGDALAEVVEENRRHMEYSCGGCYMNIPVERVNEIMTRHDTITCCPNCERILFMADELKQALGPK